jgi:hypothetical protein
MTVGERGGGKEETDHSPHHTLIASSRLGFAIGFLFEKNNSKRLIIGSDLQDRVTQEKCSEFLSQTRHSMSPGFKYRPIEMSSIEQ